MVSSYPSVGEASIISKPIKPTWRWVRKDWIRFAAFGFGSGLSRLAPGTAGTCVAIPIYAALYVFLPSIVIFALCLPLFGVGVWLCEKTGRDLGVSDHGGIVWDEIVAFLMVLSMVFNRHYEPLEGGLALALAFALFRFFDIVKPFPIKTLEQRIKGGLGVMVDDLFAGMYTLIVFYLLWETGSVLL